MADLKNHFINQANAFDPFGINVTGPGSNQKNVPDPFKVNTEGQYEMFDNTGGTKYDNGKSRLDLLPVLALEEVANVLAVGAKKYGSNNWREGMAWTRVLAAMLRHTFAWMRGEDNDEETGLSHMAHAVCCGLFLLEYVLTSTGVDNRVKLNRKEAIAPER